MVIKGEEIKDGMDLGVPGYEKVTVKKGAGDGIIVVGEAWVDVDKSNYGKYPF
jgi:simple sugar transport system substrate-binding protein